MVTAEKKYGNHGKNMVTMENFMVTAGKKTKPRKNILGNLYLLLKSIRGNPENLSKQCTVDMATKRWKQSIETPLIAAARLFSTVAQWQSSVLQYPGTYAT